MDKLKRLKRLSLRREQVTSLPSLHKTEDGKITIEFSGLSPRENEKQKSVVEIKEPKKNQPYFQLESIVKEIISTERVYVQDLQTMIEDIMKPMKEKTDFLTGERLVSASQMNDIWSNIAAICSVNSMFLEQISPAEDAITRLTTDSNPRTRLRRTSSFGSLLSLAPQQYLTDLELKNPPKRPSAQRIIAEAFNEAATLFKIYLPYCNNQNLAMETLAKLCENSQFEAFLNERADIVPECRNLLLNNMLIKPIQRICKYPLLLRELRNATEATSPDLEVLASAQANIESLVDLINASKKQLEYQGRVMEIFENLTAKSLNTISIVTPSRYFSKLGELENLIINSTCGKQYSEITGIPILMLSTDFVFVLQTVKTKFNLRKKLKYEIICFFPTKCQWRILLPFEAKEKFSNFPESVLFVAALGPLEFVLENDSESISLHCETDSLQEWHSWLESCFKM